MINSLFKDRFLIGRKSLGGPGCGRHTVIASRAKKGVFDESSCRYVNIMLYYVSIMNKSC